MNLLASEKIFWTVPAPSWARKEVRKLAVITGEKRQAEREKIIASLPLLIEYALTFSSATIREEGTRSELLRAVTAWFEEKYGITPPKYAQWWRDTFLKGEESNIEYPQGAELVRDEANRIYLETLDIGRWATVMTCLTKVETRKVSMVDDNDEPAWTEIAIPTEWKDFHGFLDAFPRQLFETATEVCDNLNPGVWHSHMDADSKNFGGVSVRQ